MTEFEHPDFSSCALKWVPVTPQSVGGIYVTNRKGAIAAYIWRKDPTQEWYWKVGPIETFEVDDDASVLPSGITAALAAEAALAKNDDYVLMAEICTQGEQAEEAAPEEFDLSFLALALHAKHDYREVGEIKQKLIDHWRARSLFWKE
ncbi:hypothetical protein [Rhizobium giardinii]|uniref:hypothetical protein n=1 Tax=Rhizobium giardinii TaxID=56731 RepID=UPI003D6DEC04